MLLTPFHGTTRRGETLGAGRLGPTWEAEGPGGRRLVLKRLAGLAPAATEAAEMAERMAAVPACVAPVGVEARDGDLWILYPFVEGAGPVDAAAVRPAVGTDLARAVADLHAGGLVHGTLCDSHVRVTATGEIRLLEVGLSGLGALGAVGAATAEGDRRDLAALLDRMTAAAEGGRRTAGGAGRRRPAGSAGSEQRRRVGAAVLAGVAVVVVAWFGVARAGGRSAAVSAHDLSDDAVHTPLPPPSPSSASRCVTGSLPGLGAASYFAVDMDGTGCAEPLAWARGGIVTVSRSGARMQFALGRSGDVLLLGHWFCSRGELPALYRPDTGQVFYIRAWPVGGRTVTSDPAIDTGVRDGRAHASVTGQCQHVVVVR